MRIPHFRLKMDTHVSSLVKTIRLGIVIILLGSTVGCMKELVSISPYVTRMTLAAVIATQVGGLTEKQNKH